jgi:predicted DNA-binding antitoxin AbrB/MazE fold protein
MTLTVEAVYENGVLKLAEPLPLAEHTKVVVTVHPANTAVERTGGIIACTDPKLIQWAAMDPELEYPPPSEEP